MLRGLVSRASRWLHVWSQDLFRERLPGPDLFAPAAPKSYRRLTQVLVTEEVKRTLFDDYAAHRAGARGDEEVGWVLLGLRDEDAVTVLATLPAGADRQAGVAHVRFNSTAQAVASRFVRQQDRRLGIVGVVHTHPGSLRHPSEGDYQGDSLWVGQLRGGEGAFGIGTADPRADDAPDGDTGHMQIAGPLRFSWYALGAGDARYRRLPVGTILGPDLARPLHPIWDTIEAHADALDTLCRQLARVVFEVVPDAGGPALVARVPLPEPGTQLRILLRPEAAQYVLEQDGELTAVDPREPALARAVYLILAELAGQNQRSGSPGVAPAGR